LGTLFFRGVETETPSWEVLVRTGEVGVDGCEILHQLVDGLSMFIHFGIP